MRATITVLVTALILPAPGCAPRQAASEASPSTGAAAAPEQATGGLPAAAWAAMAVAVAGLVVIAARATGPGFPDPPSDW